MDLIQGKSREVERTEPPTDNLITSMYAHIGNLMTLPTYIIDNIYLGNALNASSIETLHKFSIQGIINITHDIPSYYPDDITYLNISVRDTRDSFLESHLETAYRFIQQNSDKNILVHCYMGSSRSASLVIYYLMRQHGMPYQEAQEFVKNKRPVVNLNTNFARELQNLPLEQA
jgi:protein-tyrosine phosphatase